MLLTSLKEQLIKHEGIRLKAYRDSVGILTIGVGRNLEAVGITAEEAMAMLDHDIARTIEDLQAQFLWYPSMDGIRQMVLINMAFNLGLGGLCKFKKFLAHVQAGSYAEAAAEMLDSAWAVQVGKRAQELAIQMQTGELADGQ